MPPTDDLGPVISRLAERIAERRGADPATSYSARLLADPKLAAKKLGEEAIETVIAALAETPGRLAEESADLLYHWLVLLEANGVSTEEVARCLAAREGRSGLEEKAARKPSSPS